MVHEKYIKKGGKIFGPYLYETKRVNGKVVTNYIGKPKESRRKRKLIHTRSRRNASFVGRLTSTSNLVSYAVVFLILGFLFVGLSYLVESEFSGKVIPVQRVGVDLENVAVQEKTFFDNFFDFFRERTGVGSDSGSGGAGGEIVSLGPGGSCPVPPSSITECGCELVLSGETYLLDSGIPSTDTTCLSVVAASILIDGQGNSISCQGAGCSSGSYGLEDATVLGFSVQDVVIQGFDKSVAGFSDTDCEGSNVFITGSSVEEIDVHGPIFSGLCNEQEPLGFSRGGNVDIVDSTFTRIDNHKENQNEDVGHINIVQTSGLLDLSDVFIDGSCIDGPASGECTGKAAKLTVNYSGASGFVDNANTDYGSEIRLHIIDPDGEIDWGDELSDELNLDKFSLSSNVQIGNSLISFNDPKLDQDAVITFYDVPQMDNPDILRNGVPCSSAECIPLTALPYEGVVSFLVQGVGVYALEAGVGVVLGGTPTQVVNIPLEDSVGVPVIVDCVGGGFDCENVEVSLQYEVGNLLVMENGDFDIDDGDGDPTTISGWTKVDDGQGAFATMDNLGLGNAHSGEFVLNPFGNTFCDEDTELIQEFEEFSADRLKFFAKGDIDDSNSGIVRVVVSVKDSNDVWQEIRVFDDFGSQLSEPDEWNLISDADLTGIGLVKGVKIEGDLGDGGGFCSSEQSLIIDSMCLANSGNACIFDFSFIPESVGNPFYVEVPNGNPQVTGFLTGGQSEVLAFEVFADIGATPGDESESFAFGITPDGSSYYESGHWIFRVVEPDFEAPTVVIVDINGDNTPNPQFSINEPQPLVTLDVTDNLDLSFVSCKVDPVEIDFDLMSFPCSYTGGSTFECQIDSDLAEIDGVMNAVCRDSGSNEDNALEDLETDYSTPDQLGSHDPAPEGPIQSDDVIMFTTDELANCRASLSDESYDDMSNDVECTGGPGIFDTAHSCSFIGLPIQDDLSIHFACADDTEQVSNEDDMNSNTDLIYDVFSGTDISDCSSGPVILDVPGETYTITQPLTTSGDCIIIQADGVTVEGNGFSITGDGGFPDDAISSSGFINLNVRNVVINNFGIGVKFDGVSNSVVESTSFNSGFMGISMVGGQLNEVLGNNFVSNNRRSVFIIGSAGSLLDANTYIGNSDSIVINSGANTIIRNEVIQNSLRDAIFITGIGSDDIVIESVQVSGTVLDDIDLRVGVNNLQLIDTHLGQYSFSGNFIIFNDTGEGSIEFLQPLIGQGSNLNDDVVGVIRINPNSAFVGPALQPAFNIDANVVLEGVGPFVTPIILRDGLNCDSGICTPISPIPFPPNEVFDAEFHVTSWSTYSVGEFVCVANGDFFSADPDNKITWSNILPPVSTQSADDNNDGTTGLTDYIVQISSNVDFELRIRADGDLQNQDEAGYFIPLDKETYFSDSLDQSVPGGPGGAVSLTTDFTPIVPVANFPAGDYTIYFKFYLGVDQGQRAGTYTNTVPFNLIPNCPSPP